MFIIAASLWLPLLPVGLLWFGAHDYGSAMAFGIVVVMWMKFAGIPILLLFLYALIKKPWRLIGPASTFFWWQTPAVLINVIVLSIGISSYVDDVKEQSHEQQVAKDLLAIASTLASDDPVAFSRILNSCGGDCDGPWLNNAIAYNAPRIVAKLLSSETPKTFKDSKLVRDWNYFDNFGHGGCWNGTLYYLNLTLSGLVAFRDNPAITRQMMPFWDKTDLQEALRGAAAGDHVELMEDLVARGAKPDDFDPNDAFGVNVLTEAEAGGAVHALQWLAAHGVRAQGNGTESIWGSYSEWTKMAPLEVVNARIDALIDAAEKLGASPAPPAGQAQPLEYAVREKNGLLAAALVRHGARRSFLDPYFREQLNLLLKNPAADSVVDPAKLAEVCAKPGKGESRESSVWRSSAALELFRDN